MALLQIEDFGVSFGNTKVVEGVSLAINPGESVALVGESGSGKSVTALALTKLLPADSTYSGRVLFEGTDTLTMDKKQLSELRGKKVSYIFQDPGTCLNPAFRVGHQLLEVLKLHRPEAASYGEVIRLLERVRISDPAHRCNAYPHQLSGGMQQRIMIAMATASNPRLLIADEPTTALDVTIQAEILRLLNQLRQEIGMSMIFVTHNLGIVPKITDRIAVMYAGQIVEEGPTTKIMECPRHPYTHALLKAQPRVGVRMDKLHSIPGNVPRPGSWPEGCRFHPRCSSVLSGCSGDSPTLQGKSQSRYRCFNPVAVS